MSEIPTRKRRYSESVDRVDESDEKRQRVEKETTDEIELDALIAKASSAAVASVHTTPNSGNTQGSAYPYGSSYMVEPQVYMRMSSSPILENLVGNFGFVALGLSNTDLRSLRRFYLL